MWTLLEWLRSFALEYSFTIFLVGGSALFLWLLVRAKGLRIPVPHLPGSANLIGALGYWKHFKPLVPPKEVWLMVLVSFSLYVALRLGFPGGKEYWWWLVPLWAGTFSLVIISLHASKLASIVFVPALLITALGIMLPNLPAYGPSGPPTLTGWQIREVMTLKQACPEQERLHGYNTTFSVVNPQGKCIVQLWFQGQCVYVQQVGSSRELGPYCDRTGNAKLSLPNAIMSVRSAGAPFTDKIRIKIDWSQLSFNYRE